LKSCVNLQSRKIADFYDVALINYLYSNVYDVINRGIQQHSWMEQELIDKWGERVFFKKNAQRSAVAKETANYE